MRYRSILCLLLIVLCTHSFSQDTTTVKPGWVLLSSGQEARLFIKSNIVKKDEEGIKLWSKTIYKTYVLDKVTYRNMEYRQLAIVNCEEKRIKIIRITCYTSTGKFVKSFDIKESQQKWKDPTPESVGDLIVTYACKNYND